MSTAVTKELGPRFGEALVYAAKAHAGQMRKGTNIPYIAHVMDVASIVIRHGGTEDQAIAALLHDAIEDAGFSSADIERLFGEEVARIVLACSDTTETPKPPWKSRKKDYLEHLRDPKTPRDVLLVSAADKLDNATDTLDDYRANGDELWERFNEGRRLQLWYYSSLARVFSERLDGPLAEELTRTVRTLVHEVRRNRRPRRGLVALVIASAAVVPWFVRRRRRGGRTKASRTLGDT